MSKKIMHIDMDAFFASIEQQVNPSLRGKPVIIGGRNNKYRSIICAASYEAKALGVDNAMLSWKALKICPQAIFVPADTVKYVYTSNRIFEILQTFTPQVEKFSVDEFFMDIEGCEHLFGSAHKMGMMIKNRIKDEFGITCSIGVAPTKIMAKMAAKIRKPDGLLVLHNREESLRVLERLPIEKVPGIGRRLTGRFHRLGMTTCGQLAQYPDHLVQEHFGVVGLWLKDICLVRDKADIGYAHHKKVPPKSVGNSQTLRQVTENVEYIKEWIYLLSEMIGQRMRHKQLQGKTVHFYMSNGFHGGYSKQKTFYEPTYDGYEIYQRCLHILELFNLSNLAVRVLGISVSSLTPLNDYHLFEPQIRRERLMRSIDQINDRFGEWTIYPATLKRASY